MLSSADPVVACVAQGELQQTVRHFAQSAPTPSLISNYLSSNPDDRLTTPRYRAQSLWTRAKKAARCLKVQFHISNTSRPTISIPDSGPIQAHEASRALHFLVQDDHATSLTALPDQGKVARALQADLYSNGSTWQFTGMNIRFKDWRFIHRARLNCIPLNSAKARWSDASPRCRHCPAEETLPHVLCHCPPNMVEIRHRHNKIVDRLVNAVRFGEVITDRTVAESNINLRPDIVIHEDNRAIVIDVCCPFDNGEEAFPDAAQLKIAKYEPIKNYFLGQGLQCEILPFVIGALGSWYPPNEIVLRRLGMTKSYKKLFRKLCCSDVIQGSSDIYRQHLGMDQETAAQVQAER